MITTPYGPILYETDPNDCCEGRPYRQEIFATDEVVLQVQVEACPEAVEEITNIEVNSAPWVRKNAEGTTLTPSGQLFNGFTVEQPVTLTTGDWYEIQLVLQYPNSINTSGVIRQNKIAIEGFDETLEVNAATGNYTFYGKWGAGTDLTLRRTDTSFEPDEGNGFMPTFIFSISIKPMVAPTIEAIGTNGGVFGTVAIFDLQYPFVNINYLPSPTAIAAGCFRIRITHGCTTPTVLTTETIFIVYEDPCYMRLVGCGTNTFFQGGYAPTLRVKARFVDDGPVGVREIARNSRGVHRLGYGHVNFSYLLDVEEVPEQLRHFLYLLPYMEAVAIQRGAGTPDVYFALEDAEKDEYPLGDDSLAGVQIRFVKKSQNLTARYFGTCFPSLPPFVLGERSSNVAITDETETILINAN